MPKPAPNGTLKFTVTVAPLTDNEVKAIVLKTLKDADKLPYNEAGMQIIRDAISEAMANKISVEIE